MRGFRRTRTPAAREFARRLRAQSTDAERRLWRLLRGRHFEGFKFRRQYPTGIYFLDFFCVEARLAVELDGGGHGFPGQRQQDTERESFLASQGIKTLRFWNHQLRGELEAIRFEIWHALMERTGNKDALRHLQARPLATQVETELGRKLGAAVHVDTPHPDPLPSEGRGKPALI